MKIYLVRLAWLYSSIDALVAWPIVGEIVRPIKMSGRS